MRQGCFRSAGCGSSGFGRRANLLKSYFSGFRPAEMHFFRRKNRFLLREASRTSDSAFPASSSFYHLLTPKGGTKSVRQAKSSGNGRRMHLKRYSASSRPRFRRRIRRPFFFPLFRNAELLCASRNDDYLLVPILSSPLACPNALLPLFSQCDPADQRLAKIQLKDSLFGRSRRAATHSYPTIDPHPGILSGFLRRRTERIFNS